MKEFQITVPKPCHENWGQMSPSERGRFCDSCLKTVVDFSSMKSNEVQDFFREHEDEKICGHFRNDQLSRPVHIEISENFLKDVLLTGRHFLFPS